MFRRFLGSIDPAALALSAVLAVAALLPFMSSADVSRDFYFFDVTLTSSAPGLTGLAWNRGQGYTESESSVQPLKVETRPIRYRYMMPPGAFTGLQLTPNSAGGAVQLDNARVVDKWGRLIRQIDLAEFHPRQAAGASTLEYTAPALLQLPVTARMRLLPKPRLALLVFLAAALLGLRPVAARLRGLASRATAPLAAHPRRSIAAAAAVAVAIQAYPVLFLGRSLVSPGNGSLMLYGDLPTLPGSTQSTYSDTMGSDVGALLFQHLYYPMVAHQALLDGELPLWNRYSLAGEPLLGQGQSMVGDPLNVVTILANGAAWAWDFRFLATRWLFAAGLGFGVWRLTRHAGASVLVAASAAHIGLYLFRINHPATFSVSYAAWIPWVWLGLLDATTRPRDQPGWLAGLVVVNACVLMSGTVKEAVALIVCLNIAGLAVLLTAPAPARQRLALLAKVAFAAGVLVLVTAPHWITFLTTLGSSVTGYDNPSANPYPFSRLLGLFDELFLRQGSTDEHVTGPALNFMFLVGFLAWLAWLRSAARAEIAVALAGLIPLAIGFSLVPRSLILQVPFLRNIGHVGDVFACALLILVALLAGCGFARLLAGGLSQPDFWRRFAIGLGVGSLLAAAYFIGTHGGLKSPFFVGYAASLAVAAGALVVAARLAAASSRPQLLVVGAVFAIPLLLWRHGQYTQSEFNRYVFVPGARENFHASSPAADAVNRAMSEPSRVIGWDQNLFPAYNTALGWESLYGVDALRSPAYDELAKAFDLARVWYWDFGTPQAEAAKYARAHDLLNARFSLGTRNRDAPAGSALIAALDLDVYESPTAWPRAFFTDRAALYETVPEFARMVGSSDGHPFAAIQRGTADAPGLPPDLPGRAIVPASTYRLTANTTRFAIDAPSPGLAVLTETYYPDDFQVTLDGAPNKYFRVNHAFKGVFIPTPGHHELTFTYRPRYWTLSLLLSALGLFSGAAGWYFLRHPRSGPPTEVLER